MRKFWVVILVGTWAVGMGASGEPVSVPAGFVSVCLAPGESKAVSLPWFPWDDSIQAVLARGMKGATNGAGGDRALKYDPALPGYATVVRVEDGSGTGAWVESEGGVPAGGMTLNPGEGIIVENRSVSELRTLFLAGEVVMEAEYAIELEPGLNLVGPPYAAPGTNELEGLRLGGAGWIWSDQRKTLRFVRPYADRFPSDPMARPRILTLTPMADAGGVVLGIGCSGEVGEKLDIYAQDLASNSVFCADGPWRVKAANLSAQGRTELTWQDDFRGVRPYARVYLVARVDDGRAGEPLDGTGVRRLFLNTEQLARIEAMETVAAATNGLPDHVEIGRPSPDVPEGQVGHLPGSNRRNVRVIYVNQATGRDAFTGRLSSAAAGDGPKKSISAGREATRPGDRMIIHGGRYGEDLNLRGLRDVKVSLVGHVDLRGRKGPDILDAGEAKNVTTNIPGVLERQP